MRVALMTVCYNEERLIKPFLSHIPDWVSKKLVLVSNTPWHGIKEKADKTADIARSMGADVIVANWDNEESQRNSGLDMLQDYDWVLVFDPDEYLSDLDWHNLKGYLEPSRADAIVVEGQYTYWKNGWVATPPKDYQMLIAVRPSTRFVDKRIINTGYSVAPIWLHHMSWAKTDAEVLSKITHYGHAKDFDTDKWYKEVWLKWKPGMKNVHPTTPETLHNFVKAELPKELEELNLWP
jgi:glycosyltransferase involved in cell wall biosynthesis